MILTNHLQSGAARIVEKSLSMNHGDLADDEPYAGSG